MQTRIQQSLTQPYTYTKQQTKSGWIFFPGTTQINTKPKMRRLVWSCLFRSQFHFTHTHTYTIHQTLKNTYTQHTHTYKNAFFTDIPQCLENVFAMQQQQQQSRF